MDSITFRQHLDLATTSVIDFTRQYCYNAFPASFRYVITPNTRIVAPSDEHLSEKEKEVVTSWNRFENKLLTAEEVVGLLHHDNTVPVWIDITVYEARPDRTILDLLCSRRLRPAKELMHRGEGTIPPFHLQIALPPDHLKVEKDGKFDANWKKRHDVLSFYL